MAGDLACDKFWVNKNLYHDAEKKYYENLAKKQKDVSKKRNSSKKINLINITHKEDDLLGGVGMARLNQDRFPKTSLAGEVAKARQHIKSSLECMDQTMNGVGSMTNSRLAALLEKLEKGMDNLTRRVEALEKKCASCPPPVAVCPAKPQTQAPKAAVAPAKKPAKDDDDDDVDLFGSDPEEEDEESKKIREQRLAEYAAKKSKKPAVVAKSNIILDIKPWDDETDMAEMEKAVRAIEMDGLIWGASKLMPVAFKIFKLQISCVVEDDKVSVDLLTETLEQIEDYIQSVDIAAFNKV